MLNAFLVYSFNPPLKSLKKIACFDKFFFQNYKKFFGIIKIIPEYNPTINQIFLNKKFCFIWPDFGIQNCYFNYTIIKTEFFFKKLYQPCNLSAIEGDIFKPLMEKYNFWLSRLNFIFWYLILIKIVSKSFLHIFTPLEIYSLTY